MTKQQGFSLVEGVLILVIAGLIGAVGYKVYTTRQNTDKTNQASIAAQGSAVQKSQASVPAINNSSDLDSAQAVVDLTNPDDNLSDMAALSSQVQAF